MRALGRLFLIGLGFLWYTSCDNCRKIDDQITPFDYIKYASINSQDENIYGVKLRHDEEDYSYVFIKIETPECCQLDQSTIKLRQFQNDSISEWKTIYSLKDGLINYVNSSLKLFHFKSSVSTIAFFEVTKINQGMDPFELVMIYFHNDNTLIYSSKIPINGDYLWDEVYDLKYNSNYEMQFQHLHSDAISHWNNYVSKYKGVYEQRF